MDTTAPAPESPPRELSRNPLVGWAMLAIALPLGGWLIWEIQRTIGLGAPRFWELLGREPVFDVAMLDFMLTATFAALVLIDRARARKGRNVLAWVAVALCMAIPCLGIAMFLIVDRTERRRDEPTSVR